MSLDKWAIPEPFREAVHAISDRTRDSGMTPRWSGVLSLAMLNVRQEDKVPRTSLMPSPAALDVMRAQYEKLNTGEEHMWADDLMEVITLVHGHQEIGDSLSPNPAAQAAVTGETQ